MKQKKKKNKWKTSAIILFVFFLGLCVLTFYNAVNEVEESKDIFKEKICNEVKYTPSWAVKGEGIFDYGYKNFKPNTIEEVLISRGIYFIYNPGCGACRKQIESFEDDWEKYVESGYTINCQTVRRR